MAEKAGRVHFYHHFSSRLLVQKTRCPVHIPNAVPSVHCLRYKDMNLRSVKYLFTAASLLLPVEHDLARQAVASVASSMSLWTRRAFLGGLCMAHRHGSVSLMSSVVLNSTYLVPLEGGDIFHTSPIKWFAWVTLIRLQGEEHPEGAVLLQSCASVLCYSLPRSLWAWCGPEWLWSKGLCWQIGAAKAGTVL